MRVRNMGFKEKCKSAARKAVFAGALMVSSLMPLCSARAEDAPASAPHMEQEADAWAAVRPGYLPRTNQMAARLEGGGSFPRGTSFYGFADFEPSQENSASLDTFYSELRVNQELYRGLGVYAELDSGSGMVSVFRPGISYTLNSGAWLLQLRFSPYSFGGAEDVQLAGYASRTFANRIFTEFLLKGNALSGTIYAESAVDVLFLERFSAGLQVRVSSEVESGDTDVSPVLRASVTF